MTFYDLLTWLMCIKISGKKMHHKKCHIIITLFYFFIDALLRFLKYSRKFIIYTTLWLWCYMYLTMLYPINDLNLNFLLICSKSRISTEKSVINIYKKCTSMQNKNKTVFRWKFINAINSMVFFLVNYPTDNSFYS